MNKFELPNGNIFFYLGSKVDGIEHVLILKGGTVMFLKTVRTVHLWKNDVIHDIKHLQPEELADKYDIPADSDFLQDLKIGILEGEYPPFKKDT